MKRTSFVVLLTALLVVIVQQGGEATNAPAVGDTPQLPTVGGPWTELTALPYDTEVPRYGKIRPASDQFFPWAGIGHLGGRVQALAVDGDTVYAGAADGGVWRSLDRGDSWTPVSDDLPSLSSGDLTVDPSTGDVWYATGEAATANFARSYRGVGVFRSSDGGDSWELIGGDQLDQTLIGGVELDGVGHVYAATTNGLFRRSTSAPPSEPWTLVLEPGAGPYGMTFTTDVVVRPGTQGQVVLASFGWRGPQEVDYNGFYVSHDFGQEGTWERLDTSGDLESEEIGRASFAYSSDGSRLYALVESWRYYAEGRPSRLYGVFKSPQGNPEGEWIKIAGARTLQKAKGSYTAINVNLSGLPGSQAYYNQAIGVDPTDRDHLYVGLEELYETTDAGRSWVAAGTNFCATNVEHPRCRTTTHGDQHALAFGAGVVYSGNDGGVYRRPLARHTVGGWVNLNDDLHALQYYAAGIGNDGSGDEVWAGTHDNGVTLLRPGASRMVPAACCEASGLIVDPSNPDRAALVHVDNPVAITTTGGVAPGPIYHGTGEQQAYVSGRPPDSRRFDIWQAQLRADPLHPNRHWVYGGRYVWESTSGWRTREDSWERLYDAGAENLITALDVSGDTIYAGWCGPLVCDPDPAFASGIATNVGNEWHQVVGPGIVNGGDPLPNRWINSIQIDPSDPIHVYVMYGGYRRTWNFETGAGGHVFESVDGGGTWTDISGGLPDAMATDLIILGDQLVLSMDAGVFVADVADPASWSRLGTSLPNSAVSSLTLTPDESSIVASTYGRGLWSIPTP